MSFPFDIYGLGFLAAFAVTAMSAPLWRLWCRKHGLVDDPGHRKIHSEPVALAGGLAVVTGLILPLAGGYLALRLAIFHPELFQRPRLAFGSTVQELIGHGFTVRGGQLATILAGAVAMVFLGWLDDKYELSPALKFGGQLLVASAVAFAGVRITLFVPSAVFSYAITVLWILTVTNAFNFMDNMNGLCAGLGVIGAWCCGWSAAVGGQYLVALLAFLTCGALVGFLPYNFPKATMFLGDAGSHLVGFLLSVLAILPHFYSSKSAHPWAVLTPLMVLAVPLVDLACVVVIRWRLGKPFYVGDNNHVSHRLVRRGYSKSTAVLLILFVAAFAAVAGLLLLTQV